MSTGNVGLDALAEQHFTPRELAVKWGFSQNTIRKMFKDREGVLRLESSDSCNRRYVSIRIPASVAEAVYREMAGGR